MTSKHPGVAKFGIALEWGSRGRWFESSHSDQKSVFRKEYGLFLFSRVPGTSGLLARQRVKSAATGWADEAGTPTGSNPVTRTQRPYSARSTDVFFCLSVPLSYRSGFPQRTTAIWKEHGRLSERAAGDILFFTAYDEINEESERLHKRRWGNGGKNCHSAH